MASIIAPSVSHSTLRFTPLTKPSEISGSCAVCTGEWNLACLICDRDFLTHLDPGCAPFPAPPHTASCNPPRAYSFQLGTVGSALTGCASPKCIQRLHSDPAFRANQTGLAFQRHLGEKVSHELRVHCKLADLCLGIYVTSALPASNVKLKY